MSRSATLCEFVTPVINGQPKSCLVPVNACSSVVSLGKRIRNGKIDDLKYPLVGHCDSEECEIIEMEEKGMESTETTHLLCGKSIYETIGRFGGSTDSKRSTESASNFRHYAIDPICMNVRIFIFWFLWAMLIVVLLISVLSYCCIEQKTCLSSKEIISSNTTIPTSK
ncbi:PREDICTED: uncharacterized protein LOC108575399 [Habropoda laboriosa]|uniref:uncharacterized protein LOC108575399 n=1 Tax=Habropoda laboriosa TaxID=597456 RepID=UPI00083CDE40|nr:PREDICTED: uncharacterized protein LOC108575399 [Habropoda laboriosa]